MSRFFEIPQVSFLKQIRTMHLEDLAKKISELYEDNMSALGSTIDVQQKSIELLALRVKAEAIAQNLNEPMITGQYPLLDKLFEKSIEPTGHKSPDLRNPIGPR